MKFYKLEDGTSPYLGPNLSLSKIIFTCKMNQKIREFAVLDFMYIHEQLLISRLRESCGNVVGQ